MKRKYKKFTSLLLAVMMIFSVSSCDLFDLDINQDPNNPTQASLELLLTNAMLDASSTFAGGLNDMASGFVGQTTSTDNFSMDNSTWNGTWNFLYSSPLNDLERIIVAAQAQGNNPHYLGVARVLKAYYFSIMVDLWGNVPYFEAFKGDQGNKEPTYDNGSLVYADLLTLIDSASVNFSKISPVKVLGDVVYGGDITKWKKAAKSLKLKLLLQTSKTNPNAAADIQALVTAGGFITSPADDFQFRFGKLKAPDDRHPWYQNGYAGGEAGANYFGHQFMVEMLAKRDPRTPFYFKRQTKKVLDPNEPTDKQTIPCSQRDDCVYSYLVLNPTMTNLIFGKTPASLTASEKEYLAGFFGRDRSDPSGIPNDNPIRTTIGSYPAGGVFDDVPETTGGNKLGSGDGIFPMITSWMVNFYLLEAQISLGVISGSADDVLLRKALEAQMLKVFSIGAAADPTITADTTKAVVQGWTTRFGWPVTFKTPNALIKEVVAAYPSTGSSQAKLQYAIKQAWFTNFGNGLELYNTFRRTGLPNDLQEPLERPRQFEIGRAHV